MPVKYPSDPIDYLLKRKFGDAFAIRLSDDEDPRLPERLRADVEAYRAELQSLPEHDLEGRVYEELENEEREQEDIEEQGRSFNQPNASAAFDYWSRLPLWTLDEAVALTLGKDPRVVTWAAVKDYVGVSPFAERFDELRRLILRAKVAKQLTDFVSPDTYIPWANANGVAIPPKLGECIEGSGHRLEGAIRGNPTAAHGGHRRTGAPAGSR